MSLGDNVKLVPENIVYGETLEDYLITVDYNLPPSKRAAQIPALGDAYAGDRYTAAQTAPWGYIAIQTDSNTSRTPPNQGAYTTRVVYAKPKIPFASGITGLYEVYRRPETGRKGRYMGRRIFLAADADAEALAVSALPELTPMAVSGNWRYALLREKQIERNWRVGIARIECAYDSYAAMGETIHVNKGVLEDDASAVMVWNRMVVPGTTKRIDEIYIEDDVRRQWVRVKGNNGWPLITSNPRIRGVVTPSVRLAIRALLGHINEDSCSNIGAAAGTLWFNQFSSRERPNTAGTLLDVLIGMAYDPAGWNTETVAQLQKYQPAREYVWKDGEKTTETIPTGSWIPDPDGTLTNMPPTDIKASFALLNGMLS